MQVARDFEYRIQKWGKWDKESGKEVERRERETEVVVGTKMRYVRAEMRGQEEYNF